MSKIRPKTFEAIAVISLLFVLFITSFSVLAYFYAGRVISAFADTKDTTALFDQTSFIYGENGDVIKEIHGGINRVPVPLEKIPIHVQQAFVAIEDERFYKHFGVDPKAILRALYSYCKSGRIMEGASTITQQTMKLYFLSPEQSLQRKAREAALALEFEHRYSKSEILEFYLNRVYFGEGAYGLQSAAKVYFNKDSDELNIAEGALLAGLIQAPSEYDPFINPDGALQRRNVVIEKMTKQGFITESQGSEACQSPLNLTKNRDNKGSYSYFIDYVIDEAIAAVGEEKLLTGGLKIYTTYEPEIQKKADGVFEQSYLFPSDKVEAAIAVVENSTGKIKALIGGRKYVARRGFNRATQLSRQPGSAFKPIAVYAPAFELGYGPDSIISDTPFKVGNYEPRNSDGGYYGQISIRTALQWSRNVAAVRLLNQIGIDKGYEMACKLGFELVEEDRCLPLALGGLTKGVSPLQMAGAYSAFANQGIYLKPYAVKYIEDPDGQVIYSHSEGTAVMKTHTANAIRNVLCTAVNSGTGYRAGIRNVEVAGKTGTVELPKTPLFSGLSGNKDAWFVGFTPHYTAAVWMGYDEKDMDRKHYLTSYGGNQPAEIFRLVMAGILEVDGRPIARSSAPPTQDAQKEEVEDSTSEEPENQQDKKGHDDKEQEKKEQEPETGDNQQGWLKKPDVPQEDSPQPVKPQNVQGPNGETVH